MDMITFRQGQPRKLKSVSLKYFGKYGKISQLRLGIKGIPNDEQR